MFLPHPRVKVSIVGSLRDREVACSASDRQGSNLESCVWRTVSSQSSHHTQEVLLAQFSLYVHKGGLKPDSFHICQTKNERNDNTVTMATNPLSTMRFHRSLGIFVIIFTRFSLISQSILNRFSCNFAGTTCNYSGDCPEKFVKFERVFLKLSVRLVVNLLEYFKIYSFRSQFRHQFITVYHVILQAPLDGIMATAL